MRDLERLHGIPGRIAALKTKLAAREGRSEYATNCEAIRAEIARLEAVTISNAAVLASETQSGENPNETAV